MTRLEVSPNVGSFRVQSCTGCVLSTKRQKTFDFFPHCSPAVSHAKTGDDVSVHIAYTLYHVREINLAQWKHRSGNRGGGQVR